MHRQETLFTVSFVVSLIACMMFLGSSITGLITMDCSGEECKSICRFNSECKIGEICCAKDNYGVCEIDNECGEEFAFAVENEDVNIEFVSIKNPKLESPAPVNGYKIGFFSLLTILILIIGLLYYMHHKH